MAKIGDIRHLLVLLDKSVYSVATYLCVPEMISLSSESVPKRVATKRDNYKEFKFRKSYDFN